MGLWHGMWHDLRNDIIMRNVILAEWLFDINYTKKRANFLTEADLLNTAGANQQGTVQHGQRNFKQQRQVIYIYLALSHRSANGKVELAEI